MRHFTLIFMAAVGMLTGCSTEPPTYSPWPPAKASQRKFVPVQPDLNPAHSEAKILDTAQVRILPATTLPQLATKTLTWTAPTCGVATAETSVLIITNYEVWSTADVSTPMQFEASTQSTNIIMPSDTWNKFYDVRSVNSLGLKSDL